MRREDNLTQSHVPKGESVSLDEVREEPRKKSRFSRPAARLPGRPAVPRGRYTTNSSAESVMHTLPARVNR